MSGVDGQGRPGDTVGLREALVVWLADTYESAYQHATVEPDFDWDVDALLALPEVAALRAKAAAADRVREVVDGMDPIEVALGGLMYVHGEVSRALDGPSPC